VPLPDFTECTFATREPDADWIAVAHEGGPVRGFSNLMPAFGEALTTGELERIFAHIRTFCTESDWPRGELNLPRPLVTEKAYPEDEAVLAARVAAEGPGLVMNEVVFEKRFGARNQIEFSLPFGWQEDDEWSGGVGDMAIGWKRALLHSLQSGSILSVTGEVVLPTGDRDRGLGKGTPVFEPFVSFGQVLPSEFFLHSQGGLELPADTDKAEREGFWRLALGRTFSQGDFGRAWSPMIELLGARELVSGEEISWDLVPQFQVTLNTRQHIMMNIGVRIPVTDSGPRETQILVYLLWDWFDGGFFEGW
jgi:hypothetical protein